MAINCENFRILSIILMDRTQSRKFLTFAKTINDLKDEVKFFDYPDEKQSRENLKIFTQDGIPITTNQQLHNLAEPSNLGIY